MADDKKDPKKDAKKPSAPSTAVEVEIFFILLVVVAAGFIVLPTLLKFFNIDIGLGGTWTNFVITAEHIFFQFFTSVVFISLFVCLFFGLGIFYVKFRLGMVKEEFKAQIAYRKNIAAPNTYQRTLASVTNLPGTTQSIEPIPLPVNPRWKNIEQNMQSSNSSDWRLAILESDIILFDMLEQIGYPGQTIADKLKAADEKSFVTLQDAWRAHRIRNIIAHQGAAYELSRTEADRTIALYKKVFDEFYFV